MSPDLVPPYFIHPLVTAITVGLVSCAQALGSEIYVGCTNGELLRYTLQAESDPTKQPCYSLLSRQSLPSGKSVNELVLIPYMSRVMILSDRQIHFYSLPSLDPVPNIKPVRHVETFAVDQHHLLRATPVVHDIPSKLHLHEERLVYSRDIPFQQGAQLARRAGQYLCVADGQYYNVIDLHSAQMLSVLPVNQAEDGATTVKPFIVVVGENEFLLLSWNGTGTIGVFITGEGDPVRGTLEWPSHPLSVCLDYPNITTLLPNGTIEVHSVETQSLIQVVPPSPESDTVTDRRVGLVASLGGYIVPSSEHSEKMRKTTIRFDRK